MKKERKKTPIVISKEIGDKKYQNIGYSTVNLDSIQIQNKYNVDVKLDRQYSVESVHQLRLPSKKTSFVETLSHMLSGNIGCGILSMGIAFKHGGIVFSTIMMLVIASVVLYNQHVLVYLASKLQEKYHIIGLTFTETIGTAFDVGPPFCRRFRNLVRNSISFFLFIGQIGTCCAYILYVSESMEQILSCYDIRIELQPMLAITTILIWSTSMIRHMKHIVPISNLANISTAISLVMILYSCFTYLPPITELKPVGDWNKLPLCFGTAIFAMEGLSLTLSVQQNMKNKSSFSSPCGVLNLTFLIVTILTTIVGFFGYWKFGDAVRDSITLNLPLKDNLFSQAVIITMVIGIFCTYTLQFFVPVQILLPHIGRLTSNWPYSQSHFYEYLLRSTLVFLTYILAALIPYFNLILSLIGAVVGSFIGFIFCPMADLITREQNDCGLLYWKRVLALISIFFGLTAFIVGTTTTLIEIYYSITRGLK